MNVESLSQTIKLAIEKYDEIYKRYDKYIKNVTEQNSELADDSRREEDAAGGQLGSHWQSIHLLRPAASTLPVHQLMP